MAGKSVEINVLERSRFAAVMANEAWVLLAAVAEYPCVTSHVVALALTRLPPAGGGEAQDRPHGHQVQESGGRCNRSTGIPPAGHFLGCGMRH